MSYTAMGTTGETAIVSREPDRSGNFVCDGTADNVQIQRAIDHVIELGGGTVKLLRGEYFLDDVVVVDAPVWIKGSGMTWQGDEAGTSIVSTGALAGENMFEFFNAGDRFHFAGMSDLDLLNFDGNNSILIQGLADASFRRIYFNEGIQNGIYILGTSFDMWNIWIQDCLFENMTIAGIKVDSADHDIIKCHILDNYFYACDIGVVLQEDAAAGGYMSWFNIRGNQIWDILKTGIQLWKECDHISIVDNLLSNIGTFDVGVYNGIRVGDGGDPASECEWISIIGNIIDGGTNAKYGISLEGTTDYVTVLGNQIHRCVTAPYNAEVGVTNVEHAHNIEV